MEGGIGFKDFSRMNSAFLSKQAWHVINNPTSLWVRFLKSLYFPNCDFLKAARKRQDSWAWASLLHGRDKLKPNLRWNVGSGQHVDIREDKWIVSGERAVTLPNARVNKVSELLDANNCCWDVHKVKDSFNPDLAYKILQTPIRWTSSEDELWWPKTVSSEFSVKSSYHLIQQEDSPPELGPSSSSSTPQVVWNWIWNGKLPQKIKFFVWNACNNILPVRANLVKKKISSTGLCPICHNYG